MPRQEQERRVRMAGSMRYWWPKLREANIRTPDTEVYEYRDWDAATTFSEGWPAVDPDDIEPLIDAVGGPPAFIRTDQASAKHDMASASRVAPGDDLAEHLSKLCRHNHLAGFAGLPWRDIVVREWIDFRHAFKAFDETRIAAEVRVFIHGGEQVSRGFYWPHDALKKHASHTTELPDDWQDTLAQFRDETLQQFDGVADALVPHVAEVFPEGYWSVDFALSESGEWYAIDMAPGVASWHPDACDRPDVDGVGLAGAFADE